MSSGGSPRSNQPAPPAPPRAMLIVVGVLGIQVLALVGSAISFVIAAFTAGGLASSLIGLAVMFLIFAAGVALAARGAWRLQRWARPASIAFELLVAIFGFSIIAGSLWMGLAAMISALTVILGFFLPANVEAYNDALGN